MGWRYSPTIEALGDPPFAPAIPGGEMKCPACTQNTPDAWTTVGYVPGAGGEGGFTTLGVEWMRCANEECQETVVRLNESTMLVVDGSPYYETITWMARPLGAVRPVAKEVPEPYRTDYLEAAAILDRSPRMSTVLSRRILADLLREFAGQGQYDLTAQIDAFRADTSHPTHVRKPLHYLREIGDFSAHTQISDQAEIIDVDKKEADWTLKVIDRLFDYFIVSPAADQALYESMDEKLGEAGRKPIKPLPDEETD